MSIIGNKRSFTLIEVLVSSAMLAFGAALIYQAYFSSLEAFKIYEFNLAGSVIMEELVWEGSDMVMREGAFPFTGTTKTISLNGKPADLEIESQAIDPDAGFYRIGYTLSQRSGSRILKLTRTTYALYAGQKKE